MKVKNLVLLDNNVIDLIFTLKSPSQCEYAITVRSKIDNPEYTSKYSELKVIPSIARFGHSIWGGGEVFGDSETRILSNELLALGANQKSIRNVGTQTGHNQRDDADILTAAYINNCNFLVSDDKKFMLKNEARELMEKHGVVVLSSDEFIAKFKLEKLT